MEAKDCPANMFSILKWNMVDSLQAIYSYRFKFDIPIYAELVSLTSVLGIIPVTIVYFYNLHFV